jgi:hypothetical protein
MNAAAEKNSPDVAKVFAAIAAIISRREGRQVRLVNVQRAGKAQQKAG